MKEGGGEGIYDFYLKKKKQKKGKKKPSVTKTTAHQPIGHQTAKETNTRKIPDGVGWGRSGPVFEELLSMNFSEYFPMAVRAPHTPKIARAAVKETAIFIFSNHSLGISPEL